jgi:beta-1,4-mannosyltransferase
VLYDRPPEQFTEAGDDRRDRLLEALSGLIPEDMAQACASSSEDRPAILVSPTSWTMDEDFTLLLDALEECDAAIAQQEEDEEDDSVFPYLVVFLTGNGPMRRRYERRIASLKLRLITVCTGWLSDEDYAVLLGAADLGLCMHTSSSGVDLPMKIAEMQGAKLPTCAFDYGDCLAEMVEPGETGLLFRDSATLAQQIRDLFRDFPGGAVQLRSMREALRNRSRPRWSEEWDGVAAGLLGLGPRPD